MKFLSVCSGIEAATVATRRLGWEPVAYAEIEPFPCAVLKHHYPHTPNLGDMTKFHEWPKYTIDVLVGGTPCQSFSVAGLRKGLADPRGNLALTFLAILDRYRPRWCLWENVPGVHSSWSDEAVRPATVAAFDPIDDAVRALRATGLDPGPSVGAGDFEEADQSSDFDCFLAALEQIGYGVATTILDAQYHALAQRRERVFVVGHLGDWHCAAAVLLEPESLRWDPPPSREAGQGVAGTITRSSLDGSGACGGDGRDGMMVPEISPPVTSKWSKESGGPAGDEVLNLVAFDSKRGSEAGAISPTLRSMGHAGTNGSGADVGKGHGLGVGAPGDPMFTLTKGDKHAVAFEPRVASGRRSGSTVGALTKESDRGDGHPCVATGMKVRRLTPRECERLQGFPDDYTMIPWDGRPAGRCPDGPRYKAIGNSMPTTVIEYIAERIQVVHHAVPQA